MVCSWRAEHELEWKADVVFGRQSNLAFRLRLIDGTGESLSDFFGIVPVENAMWRFYLLGLCVAGTPGVILVRRGDAASALGAYPDLSAPTYARTFSGRTMRIQALSPNLRSAPKNLPMRNPVKRICPVSFSR